MDRTAVLATAASLSLHTQSNQYRKGPGVSRWCVHGHAPNTSLVRSASIPYDALKKPFTRYTSGPRQGQACAVKPFNKSLKIVNKFNQSNIMDKAIKVNIPEVSCFTEKSSEQCNTGWDDSSITQSGIYQREAVLSDPIILSQNRDYGVIDFGSDGISSFFSQHSYSAYCYPY
ncbi:putative elongation factor 2 kinase [Trichoderma barbatum]